MRAAKNNKLVAQINPLSTPKGVKYECELCSKTAVVQCLHCRCTYYCSKDHQKLDWMGIHEKVCQLLVPLRTPPLVIGSEEERIQLQNDLLVSKRALIDMTRAESTKNLIHCEFELAIPGALQALRISIEVYGSGHIELVPCYLLLAEANLGLDRHKTAEEYLCLANWSILKNPECSNALKSQLYRNFGKLYASQGKLEDALHQLANDIYFSSLQVGPEHIDTSGGYYYIATVFYLQNRIDCALAMCDKVVDIWFKRVTKIMTFLNQGDSLPAAFELEQPQILDGLQVLSKITTLREECLGGEHIATGEACYTVGLLYQVAGDSHKAMQSMNRALFIYQKELGEDHQSTTDVMSSINAVRARMPIE